MNNYDLLGHMKQVAHGRWDEIASKYNVLSLAADRYPSQVPCPITGNGDTKFRFKDGWQQTGLGYHNDFGPMDILQLVSEIEKIGKGDAAKQIIDMLGGKTIKFNPKQVIINHNESQKLSPENVKQRVDSIKRILASAIPAEQSDIVKKYFEGRLGRKLEISLPESLLFHPSHTLYEWDGKKQKSFYHGKHPCLLMKMIDNEGNGVTVHRIYLQENADGSVTKLSKESIVRKGENIPCKKVMSPPRDMSRSFIYLDTDSPISAIKIVGYLEGTETGIAIREATGLPIRACYSNTILEKQEGDDEDIALIFADKDRSFAGQKSAFNLATRLRRKGIEAHVILPTLPITGKGVDWLDELRAFGCDHIAHMIDKPATLEAAKAELQALFDNELKH